MTASRHRFRVRSSSCETGARARRIRSRRLLVVLLAAWPFLPAAARGGDAAGQDQPAEGARNTVRFNLSLDPDLSLETGADLTYACALSLGELEARYFPALRGRPAAGVAVRLLRTLLLDQPLAYWFVVLQHEAFGHGGRAREFGSSAGFHMGSPWAGRASYATFDTQGLSTEEILQVYAGGSESNGWSATLLARELVSGRAVRPFELFYFARSRLVTSDYVLRTTPDPERDPGNFYREWEGGGDVARYLGYLNTLYLGETGIAPDAVSPTVVREFRRLERQAYLNALDPAVWLSAWVVGRQILLGDGARSLPVPRIRGRRFLPVLSADWLPGGGTLSLETVLGPRPGTADGPRWIAFTVRRGSGPAGSFGAVGAATERLHRTERMRIGGEVEIWQSIEDGVGGGARVRLEMTRGKLRNWYFDLGARSAGSWPGRPAEPGIFFRLGTRLGPFRRAVPRGKAGDAATAPGDAVIAAGSTPPGIPGRNRSD